MPKKSLTVPEVIKIMEDRFKIVTSLAGDLSKYPLKKEDHLDFATDKDRSRTFAEVFTPIYMVDQMLSTVPGKNSKYNTIDLCSGHGQFSIRIIRKSYTEDKKFNLKEYLTKKHYFNEIQLDSCWKLLWIFGNQINLAIGSALELHKLPKNWKGIWLYVEAADTWVNITEIAKRFHPYSGGTKKLTIYSKEHEKLFVGAIESLLDRFSKIVKGYKMEIKQIMSTPNGRRSFLDIISECASGVEKNWQDKATPDWVCREMVNCIPDGVNGLKRILVLFNAEFLEILVKEKKVDPRRVDFGYDSEIEGCFGKAVYGVNTFSVGKSFKELCEALREKSGMYDVVFSNPPYQIADGGYKASARPIYHNIVCHAIDYLNPRYVCMITPSRWMVGGKGLNDYRSRMLSDRRVRMIQDFPGEKDVFKSVIIKGGVIYFLWDREYDGPCEFNGIHRYLDEFDIVVRDNISVSILKKVLKKHPAGQFCDKKVLPQKPFGLRTFFKDWVPEGTPGSVKCYNRLKGKNFRYVLENNIRDNHKILHKWKVLTSRANGAGQECDNSGSKTILSAFLVCKPRELCTETLIVTGTFDTKTDSINYSFYMNTRFYRFMLSLRVISQDINKHKFSWVPDFKDYTVQYTDEDLYKHFGLTKHEINHIEKTIKSLN